MSVPAGVVLSIATDQLLPVRTRNLTDHVDVVARDTDGHVDNAMYPDRL